MSDNESKRDPSSSQRPRSPRVPVDFSMVVEGVDRNGEAFKAEAQATKISRGGATMILDIDIDVGTVVKLVPSSGPKLDAKVNGSWIDELDGRRRIGVKLLSADGWFAT